MYDAGMSRTYIKYVPPIRKSSDIATFTTFVGTVRVVAGFE